MKPEKTLHDELEATGVSFKTIRPDRLSLVNENCHVQVEGHRYRVVDMSPFGLAFVVPSTEKVPPSFQAQIFYGGAEFAKVDLRVVRSTVHNENELQLGAEVEGPSLDLSTLDVLRSCQRLQNDCELKRKKHEEVHEPIKALVYEIKSWLDSVKQRTLELEGTWRGRLQEEVDSAHESAASNLGRYLAQTFSPLYDRLENLLNGLTPEGRKKAYEFYRETVGPYIYEAPYARRGFFKPLGYAGDFAMMNHLYENKGRGEGLFAQAMHKYCINLPAGRAVRNRGEYLFKKILSVIEMGMREKRRVRILSVACGPAIEVKRLIAEWPDLSPWVEFILLDQDLDALKFAQGGLYRAFHENKAKFQLKFYNLAIKNVIEQGLPDREFDLIYTAGLFDYLSDAVAAVAAGRFVQCLKPEGQLIVGNFSHLNPDRFAMELALDWNLIYRDEANMKKIFNKAGKVLAVDQEDLGINLFALVAKPG